MLENVTLPGAEPLSVRQRATVLAHQRTASSVIDRPPGPRVTSVRPPGPRPPSQCHPGPASEPLGLADPGPPRHRDRAQPQLHHGEVPALEGEAGVARPAPALAGLHPDQVAASGAEIVLSV